jgi:hypothetical protein
MVTDFGIEAKDKLENVGNRTLSLERASSDG